MQDEEKLRYLKLKHRLKGRYLSKVSCTNDDKEECGDSFKLATPSDMHLFNGLDETELVDLKLSRSRLMDRLKERSESKMSKSFIVTDDNDKSDIFELATPEENVAFSSD